MAAIVATADRGVCVGLGVPAREPEKHPSDELKQRALSGFVGPVEDGNRTLERSEILTGEPAETVDADVANPHASRSPASRSTTMASASSINVVSSSSPGA